MLFSFKSLFTQLLPAQKRLGLLSIVLASACSHLPQSKIETVYDAPDQVLWHGKSQSWFVSNLGGGISLAKDGYGWITKLDSAGQVINPRWVAGLDAPSGMISTDEKLYVCDREGIVQIDIASGRIDRTYLIPTAEFINDIAIAGNDDLYVSDFFGNVIYRLPKENRQPEVFVEIDHSPDGVYISGSELIVVTWGEEVNRETFETTEYGTVLSVDLVTKKVAPFSDKVGKIGNLEGITRVGDDYFITDWMNGKLLKVSSQGTEIVLEKLKNPTDPDYSKELNVIAFPEHSANRVTFYQLD